MKTVLALLSAVVLSACGPAVTPVPTATPILPAEPAATVPTVAPTPSATALADGRFEVQGHRLFMECSGTGSPTVIFLHGLGGNSSDWSGTLGALGDVHTCIYDRVNAAGGRSSTDTARHTATDSVEELHTLLDVAGIDPPYLLVGHSYGGELALMYAGSYMDDIAGVLLLDANLPIEAELDPPSIRDAVRADMNNNPERLDFYEAYADTAAVLEYLPPVPITYMYALIQDLPPEWPEGAYYEKLREWVDGLPKGRLVESQSDHHMPRRIPNEIAAEIRGILGP